MFVRGFQCATQAQPTQVLDITHQPPQPIKPMSLEPMDTSKWFPELKGGVKRIKGSASLHYGGHVPFITITEYCG